jgi:hypothetical protein
MIEKRFNHKKTGYVASNKLGKLLLTNNTYCYDYPDGSSRVIPTELVEGCDDWVEVPAIGGRLEGKIFLRDRKNPPFSHDQLKGVEWIFHIDEMTLEEKRYLGIQAYSQDEFWEKLDAITKRPYCTFDLLAKNGFFDKKKPSIKEMTKSELHQAVQAGEITFLQYLKEIERRES